MRPIVLTLTGNGASTQDSVAVVDWRNSPFNIGLAESTSGSTTTMTVFYTYDAPQGFTSAANYAANATWFTITALSAKTAATDTVFTTPCRALKFRAGATGTDIVKLTIVQGGSAL